VGLIADLADEEALPVARFEANPSNADARRPVRRPRTAIRYLADSTCPQVLHRLMPIFVGDGPILTL